MEEEFREDEVKVNFLKMKVMVIEGIVKNGSSKYTVYPR